MGLALGFLHSRTNLSPFTKDFRGGDQFDEYLTIFLRSGFGQTDNYQWKRLKLTGLRARVTRLFFILAQNGGNPCHFFLGWGMALLSGQIRSILDSIVVSIPACHAGDQGSIPCRGVSWRKSWFQNVTIISVDFLYNLSFSYRWSLPVIQKQNQSIRFDCLQKLDEAYSCTTGEISSNLWT